MGIWDSLRRFTRPSKINSGRRYHTEDSQPAHTKKRGLRLEQFEERMLLSISPSGLDSETLWKHALSIAVEQAENLDNYSEEALAATDSWVVGLTDSTVAKQLAAALGADQLGEAQYLDDAYVWQFSDSVGWESVSDMLGSVETVDYFYPLVPQESELCFAPNDPLYPDQWHLNNTGQSGGTVGADANVELAWDLYDGSGVVIGIVDDGLQYTHPDLTGNYRADLSYDYADHDADPAPYIGPEVGYDDDDSHGTSVAGVAAAQGNNSIGVSGAAPAAELAGLRLDFVTGMITDAEAASALSHANDEIDVYNNSWGFVSPFVDLGPQTLAALYDGVTNGRDGLGSIYTWAAGNSAEYLDNANYEAHANSRFTIAVGALDHDGVRSYYSEPGACLLVSAYSNGWASGITTTDLLGTDGYNYIDDATDGDALADLDYNSTFGGTSSATPLVSGVVALMLEANPNLTYRDVQHILVESAAMTDATNSDWVINGGGYHVNHEYGFGAIDAAAAVELAADWETVAEEQWLTSGRMTVNQAIPDSSVSSVSSTITMDSDIGSIEWVEVVFDADHTFSGDLEIILTSPSGTESVLATTNPSTTQYDNWTFTSARHWGETSAGDWTLTVRDTLSEDVGTFEAWELNIYGTQAGVAPELVAVLPNSGELILGGEVLEIAPRELTLRFSEGQIIDVNSLQWTDADGQIQSPIQVFRAGDDGQFDTADDVAVEFGWIGRGDEDGGRANEIIVRFAETLPDDLYQLRVIGTGDHPLRNNYGISFRDGEDFTTQFELDLGAQVTAVVPQPVVRDASGGLEQLRNQIDVYFNNDDLSYAAATNPEFYTLLYTEDTATEVDDTVAPLHPTEVRYDATADKVELIFAHDLAADDYSTGAVRLRIGTEYEEIDTKWYNLSNDPADTFAAAEDLGNLGTVTAESLIIAAEIEPVVEYALTWPGALDEPGHRELPGPYGAMDVDIEDHLMAHFGADVTAGISTFAYNFNENYGALPGSGIPSNMITEAQKDLVRQIFDIYAYYLGVQFVETDAGGFNIAVGDLRALGFESGPGGVAGLGGPTGVLLDAAEDWQSTFGGNFFFVAMHEIGHSLGFGHSYDLPAPTVMGNESFYGGTEYYEQLFEAIWPGDNDIIHGQYMYRPDSNDIDLYKFVPDKSGRFSAETIAERMDSSSSLDSVLTLFDGTTGEVLARNDDYFSEDSYLEFELEAGKTYYIGVTASGNDDYDPNIEDSGIGGTTQGEYELRLTFEPDADAGRLVDETNTVFDGDADGIAGGEYNFWFNVQKEQDTLYVDKAASGGTGAQGSLDNPYTTIAEALAAAGEDDIVRIVGNGGTDGRLSTTDDNLAYEIGVGKLGRVLADGENMEVPQGVTVMIDGGALFKLSDANIDVGSSAEGIDRSEGALQVLGTPEYNVIFTSHYDESLGVDSEPLATTPFAGDWGGLVFRNDLDYDDLGQGRTVLEREGIFLNYVNHADIRYGGGVVTVNAEATPYYPIHMVEARPTISYNTITNSAHAALSADPNSFMESKFFGDTYTLDYDRVGPDMYGNRLVDNSINGIYVRIQTEAGKPIDELEVAGRFDDLDMVHVVLEDLIISGTPGGLVLNPGQVPLAMAGVQLADAGAVVDGYTFTVTDGDAEVVFEFEDTTVGDGVPSGHVAVAFTPGDTVETIANAMKVAIEAEVGFDVTLDIFPDGQIVLNGDAGTSLTPLTAPLGSLDDTAFEVLDVSYPMDGYQFEISDGANTLTFEFENTAVGDGVDGFFTIPVSYTPGTDTPTTVAETIVDLISFANTQGFEVSAEVDGTEVRLTGETSTATPSYQFANVVSPFAVGTIFKASSTRSDVDWSLDLADGQTFELFDGTQRVVFEFDDLVEGDGVEAGHFAIGYEPGYLSGDIVVAVADAINQAHLNSPYINITATVAEGLIFLDAIPEMTIDLDSSLNARTDGRLRIDSGLIVKLDGTRIETEIGSQLIAEGTDELPIVFTSLHDDRYGAAGTFDTASDNDNLNPTSPTPGDWGGLFFGVTSSGSVDHARIYFGGGEARVEGGYGQFNPIEIHQADVRVANTFFNQNLAGSSGGVSGSSLEGIFDDLGTNADPENGALFQGAFPSTIPDRVGRGTTEPATIFVRGAQPVIAGNVFVANAGSTISIDANSMKADYQSDWGRSTGSIDTFDNYNDNYGPLVRENRLADNQINGMEIRGAVLTSETVWDDTDIVHVLRGEITVPNYHHEGGLRLQSSDEGSLVVKLDGEDTAGFTAAGKPQEIDDRIGGTIQIVGTASNPVILTALADDTVGAGFDPWDQPQYDTDNINASPTEGSWRSIKLEEYSNDRNVAVINEQEDAYAAEDENGLNAQGKPATAEYLGALAANIEGGDDNLRLGFEVNGFINFDDVTDKDVYYFQAKAGTEIWIDIDETRHALDTIVELIDADGNVLASSDNSYDDTEEAGGAGDLTGTAMSMDRDMWDDDLNTDLQRDFYTTNQRDAGFRVVLPGAVGETRLYYVKVSSKAVTDGIHLDASLDSTSGGYQFQVRLKEEQEVAGSTIRYADIRYATNGIEVNGLPTSSPLLVETSDVDQTGGSNNTSDTAQDIGNLLESNNNAIEVAGYLGTTSDVDWYSFDVDYTGMLVSGSVFPTVFDIDYADGMSRPNATIWVFDSAGQLVLVSQDSNIVDDQRGEEQGASVDDLSRGSFGFLDPYIGTQYLPEGDNVTYYVAVTGPGMTANALLDQPLLRLEPIDSVARIVEDHIGAEDGDSLVADDSQTLNLHEVEFHLGDVVMYVNTGNDLYTADPFTGTIETDVTDTGLNFLPNWTTLDYNDIAMRNDGRLYTFTGRSGSNATTGQYRWIDTGDAKNYFTSVDDGIVTYQEDVANPGSLVVRNVGIEFEAFEHEDNTTRRYIYAVGNANPGGPGVDYTDNLLYVFNSDGTAIDHPNSDGSARVTSDVVPYGMLVTGSTLQMPAATDSQYPYPAPTDSSIDGPVSNDDILDATQFVIADTLGQEWTFELDCGPDIRMHADGPRVVRDGEAFTLDDGTSAVTFEFDSGKMLLIPSDQIASLDGVTFSITPEGETEPVIFEFDSDDDVVDADGDDEPDNEIIEFENSLTITNIVALVSTAVSAHDAFTAAGYVDQSDPANDVGRISLQGDEALVVDSPLQTEGGYGLLDSNNTAISFEETMSESAFGQIIVSTVNTALTGVAASYANVPDTVTGHGGRITFSGALSCDITTANGSGVPTWQQVDSRDGNESMTGVYDPGEVDFQITFGAGDSSSAILSRVSSAIGTNLPDVQVSRQGSLLVFSSGNIVSADHPITFEAGGPGGDVTGLAFIDEQLYAVSDQGGLYEVMDWRLDNRYNASEWGFAPVNPATGYNSIALTNSGPSLRYIGLVASPAGTSAALSGLAPGPSNVEDGAFHNTLFATDYEGNLYAIDPATAAPQPIFVDGATSIPITDADGNPLWDVRGIDFSPVDYNLWHDTEQRATDEGHGIDTTFDDTRTTSVDYPIDGGTSYWFGFQDPRSDEDVLLTQPGVENWLDQNSSYLDTYDVPGGAYGSLVSDTFSLAGYTYGDQPVLYFNYFCETENSNDWDAARVYISNDGVNWDLLATNTDLDTESVDDYLFPDGSARQGDEIVDEGDYWRQARVELNDYAGMDNLRLRFDFNTASDTQTGDISLTGAFLKALSGQELADGDSFVIDTTTFEFDMGIGLLMPNAAGRAIQDGAYFEVTDNALPTSHTVRFEFDKDGTLDPTYTGVRVGITIEDDMLPLEVAELIEEAVNNAVAGGLLEDITADTLDSTDYPGSAMAQYDPFEFDNRVMLHGAASVTQSPDQPFRDDSRADDPVWQTMTEDRATSTGGNADDLLDEWVLGIQGNGSGNATGVPIVITQTMTAEEVAQAIGEALDRVFSAIDLPDVYTSCKVEGEVVTLIGHDVGMIVDPDTGMVLATFNGPLSYSNTMTSSVPLENPVEKEEDPFFPDRFLDFGRGQDNHYEGFYIDDIVIGFAERGEMVTGSTPDTSFVEQEFEAFFENAIGNYQLEIRRGADYGLKPVPFMPEDWVGLLRSFDTNDRLNHSVTLRAPAVDEIQHGMTFALSDGVNEVTFEFIAENIGGAGVNGVPIVFGGWESPGEMGNLIAAAINGASGFDVYASSIETSERIDLFNLARYSEEIKDLVILFDQTGYGESTGDENLERDQGYLIIESNTISYSAEYGILVDAGERDTDANWAHPSSTAPLREVNVDQLVPGIMIQNNVLNGGGSGGILFSGDTQPDGEPAAAVPFGRIVNNTIYGRGSTNTTEYGIKVEEYAGPTLLNNIVANVTVGIGVDASSLGNTVIGSTLYQDIYNNQYVVNTDTATVIDSGEFSLMLDPQDPLFVNAAAGNFYLDADSLAIDSSADSLQERESLAVVLAPLGLDPSPILAPERDLYGQLRVDDPDISPPAGMGTLMFKDRGAVDRVDRDGPTARLINPEDNDAASVDRNIAPHDVAVTGQTLFRFTIELSDGGGIGINDSTVFAQQVELYRDDVLLVEGFDYLYQYDAVNDCIHLFPAAGIWQEGYIYTIKLNNDPETGIRDLANNPLEANRSDGEVRFVVALAALDFGDAPDPSYPSLLENDGARHIILGGYYLGTNASGETESRQNALASGDSFDDGVVFDAGLWTDHTSTLTVTASREGKLDAWIDFNGDGDWDDVLDGVSEKVFDSIDLVAGENSLSIEVPDTAVAGWTFGRFRFSSDGGLDVTGEAVNGEVEDYRIRVVDFFEDYGDAPAPFPTTLADGGASHAIGGTLYLGQGVDFEFDGQPNTAATGDDSDGNDDEDGVSFSTPPVPGADAEVIVTASAVGGYLNAWVDFNLDGDWDDAGEQVFDGVALAAGGNQLTFSVPVTMQEGDQPYARFRVSSDQNLGYSGVATDGEVEDYRLSIVGVPEDFGDAPAPYPTTLADLGARHTIVAGFHLGASVDYEINGQPNATATGDDVTDNDDEDGVVFSGNLIPQTAVTATVSTVNTSSDLDRGYLNAWIDFNRDGDWDDAGEHVFVDQLLGNNTSTDLTINVPADVVAGNTIARFRYSHAAGLSYSGPASSEDAPDGEVEDYQVMIEVGDASISGWKFNDQDADGIWDRYVSTPEPGLAGVTVFLDANANGVHDTGEPITVTAEDDPATLNVDETGYYEFTGLFAGQYRVYEVIPESWDPSDWIQTTPTADTTSLPTGVTVGQYTDAGQDRYYYDVALDAATTLDDMNFGNLRQGHITITDVAIAEGNEGTTEVTVTIELTDSFLAPIEVTYETADGVGANAATVADNDYVPASGTIEFDPVGTPSPTWDVLTLTSNSTNDYDYHVSGSLVVWEEYDGVDWEIYLYDHEKFLELKQDDVFATPSDATVRVTVNNGYDRHVAVAGDKVVWAGQGGSDSDYEIFLFDYGQYKVAGDSAVVNDFVDQLTDNTYDDLNPQISDVGITWWADMPTDQEIFYYDFASGTAPVNISYNATDDFEPQLSGDRVVWHGYNTTTDPKAENLDIFFYDASTGVTQQLTSNSSEDRRPRIDGDQIVWQGKVGDDWEIFRYDIAAAAGNASYQAVNISQHTGDDINPEVSDGQMVWQGYVTDYDYFGYEQSDYEIFRYDVEAGNANSNYRAVQLTDNTVTDEMPQIDGNRIVWRNYTGGDWDVMYTEIGSSLGDSNVSDNAAYDWPAQVSDSLVVWRSRDSQDYEIMVATQDKPVATMTFTVLINGDFNVEDDESFLVKLTGATFAEIDSDQATVWILNDDGALDYGDAPASYDTLLDDNGARHVTGSGNYLGERVDAEGDGRPNLQANGDDTWTSDDEDGVVFETALVPGEMARVSVTASTGGYLNAWLDFDGDGTFADYDVFNIPESRKHREKDEQIALSANSDGSNALENIWIEAGTTELYFQVPEDAVVDGTYARFRFSSEGNLTYVGNAADGEVEDYAVAVSPIAQIVDNELHLVGTDGDDTFEFTAGTTPADWVVKVNGVEQIVPDTVERVFFDGRDGNDQVALYGTDGADTAVLEATAAELSGNGYAVFTTNVENPMVYGRAGEDTITFYDNAGRNQFVAGRGFAGYLTGFAGELRSYEFEQVTAYATDGIDEAKLYDSAGDDVFVSDPNVSTLTGGGMTITVHDFQGVHAYATLGGTDKAYFTDTELDDQLIGTHEYAILWSPSYEQGIFNRSKFFEESYAVSSHGGADIVKFYDGPGDDLFEADEHEASFTCPNKYTTSKVFVEDFVGVHAFATGLGYDTAKFYDSPGDDQYYADAIQAAMFNGDAGWYNRAKFFERTDGYATAGGTDKATMGDSAFDDNLLLDANSLTIYGADNGHHFGTSFRNRIELFDTVYAKSIGGTDVLELEDSNGTDALEATGHQLSFFSAEHNLDYVLEDIAQTTAKTDDNNTDTRKVLDYLFDIDFEGNWKDE